MKTLLWHESISKCRANDNTNDADDDGEHSTEKGREERTAQRSQGKRKEG